MTTDDENDDDENDDDEDDDNVHLCNDENC